MINMVLFFKYMFVLFLILFISGDINNLFMINIILLRAIGC